MKLDPYFAPHTKINLKYIKDVKVRPEMIKLLDENTGKSSLDLGNGFLAITPKAQAKK